MKKWLIEWIYRNCVKPHTDAVSDAAVDYQKVVADQIFSARDQYKALFNAQTQASADADHALEWSVNDLQLESRAQRAMIEALVEENTKLKEEMVKLAVYVGPKAPEPKPDPPVKQFNSAAAFRDTLERESEEVAQREF